MATSLLGTSHEATSISVSGALNDNDNQTNSLRTVQHSRIVAAAVSVRSKGNLCTAKEQYQGAVAAHSAARPRRRENTALSRDRIADCTRVVPTTSGRLTHRTPPAWRASSASIMEFLAVHTGPWFIGLVELSAAVFYQADRARLKEVPLVSGVSPIPPPHQQERATNNTTAVSSSRLLGLCLVHRKRVLDQTERVSFGR